MNEIVGIFICIWVSVCVITASIKAILNTKYLHEEEKIRIDFDMWRENQFKINKIDKLSQENFELKEQIKVLERSKEEKWDEQNDEKRKE